MIEGSFSSNPVKIPSTVRTLHMKACANEEPVLKSAPCSRNRRTMPGCHSYRVSSNGTARTSAPWSIKTALRDPHYERVLPRQHLGGSDGFRPGRQEDFHRAVKPAADWVEKWIDYGSGARSERPPIRKPRLNVVKPATSDQWRKLLQFFDWIFGHENGELAN